MLFNSETFFGCQRRRWFPHNSKSAQLRRKPVHPISGNHERVRVCAKLRAPLRLCRVGITVNSGGQREDAATGSKKASALFFLREEF